ncbi:mpv17-like protein [Calliphora vicina]|uniref:mpv17-like protein n=1 Tax=Calliphora vicina TaxID=7373 RepID=UPI00325AED62
MSVFSAGQVKSTIITIFHYVTGSCRIAFLMGAGDVLMQHYNGAKEIKHINWKRSAKFATIGLCFMGPILTYWKSLVSIIVNASHSHTTRTLKQLFCDQIYLAPCINLGIITMSSVLENESVVELEKHISEYFPYIIKRHYMLWPGVQFFGSLCIQPTLQIGFANLFAVLWYAYLSGILHKDEVLQKPNNKLEKLIVE